MSDYQRFEVEQAIILRDFLKDRVSGKELKALKYPGGLVVNGQNCTVRHLLQKGDVVELFYPNESQNSSLRPWYFPLHILYEDEALLVVCKPCGMPSIPTKHYPQHTLANALMGYYQMNKIPSTVHLVSRLDKETSGLILVAKSRRIHHLLAGCFERKYRLWVEGKMNGAGVIDASIGRYENSIKRFVMKDGKRAITDYRVLACKEDCSLVEAHLKTGRTHQIRVHFAWLGHPLLGDHLYGKAHPCFQGQALVSYYLAFTHPLTGKKMSFSYLPKAFDEAFFQN